MSKVFIVDVSPNTKLLDDVIELGDRNSGTLGFLAEEVFISQASKRELIAAIDDSDNLLGYILYRNLKTKPITRITHFCINENFRGKGISDALFSALKDRVQAKYGIILLCRRDYGEANRLWKRLNFHYQNEQEGRGKDKKILTQWWYPLNPPTTLFEHLASNKKHAVIDYNIFLDLHIPKHRVSQNDNDWETSLGLKADWLQDDVEYKITPELGHEINRQENEKIRKQNLSFASNYLITEDTHDEFDKVLEKLQEKLPYKTKIERDISDLKHLAYSIVDSKVNYYITRDKGILSDSELLFAQFNLIVFHPTDMVLHIHEYQHKDDYTSVKMSGTSFILKKVQAGETDIIVNNFQYSHEPESEKKHEFTQLVRMYLSNVDIYDCYIIESNDNLLLFVIYDYSHEFKLQIPVLRVNPNHINYSLLKHILLSLLKKSSKKGYVSTEIQEKKLHLQLIRALQEDSFYPDDDKWIKFNLSMIENSDVVADKIEAVSQQLTSKNYFKTYIQNLRDNNTVSNVQIMSEIERMFWPVKIANSSIPVVSIPIKTEFANRWFDSELARQTLFGANQERAFNREGVYYSRRKLTNIELPARVVWYVAKHKSAQGTQTIRACSILDDIVTNTAKNLFRRFQHLGIYEWRDLMNLVNDDINKEITAFRFSHTILFNNPVSYAEWIQITQSITGKRPNIQSPATMPNQVFIEIYKKGMFG